MVRFYFGENVTVGFVIQGNYKQEKVVEFFKRKNTIFGCEIIDI